MKTQTLALFATVSVAFGGIVWVFVYPYLSGEKKAEQRRTSIAKSEPVAARKTRGASKSRREQVEDSLKDLEIKHRR